MGGCNAPAGGDYGFIVQDGGMLYRLTFLLSLARADSELRP